MDIFVPSRIASAKLGLHPNTLRKLADDNEIDHIIVSKQRRYNIAKYIRDHNLEDNSEDSEEHQLEKIVYCRVSSKKQAGDLSRQIKYVQKKYPKHRIITDVGSGINFKRKGLQEILELAMQKNLKEVVVAYKDRLARIGFDLIKFIIEENGGKIVVLNKNEVSEETEFAEDIISIITVFSAKYYGSRKYKNKDRSDKTKNNKNQKTTK